MPSGPAALGIPAEGGGNKPAKSRGGEWTFRPLPIRADNTGSDRSAREIVSSVGLWLGFLQAFNLFERRESKPASRKERDWQMCNKG